MASKNQVSIDRTDKQNKTLNTFLEARTIAEDYCKPYFEKFVRFYRLFSGELPPELDGTYSKLMLQIAYSMIDNELPRAMRSILSSTNWYTMTADEMEMEDYAQNAKSWLDYQMESVQRISTTITPTYQSALVFGTGYRSYGHKTIEKIKKELKPGESFMGMPLEFNMEETKRTRSIVSGQYLSVFNVLPLPGGHLINGFDPSSSSVVDGMLVYDYLTEKDIKSRISDEGWNKKEVNALISSTEVTGRDPGEEYKARIAESSSSWDSYSQPDWIKQSRNKNLDFGKRFLVAVLYLRDRWIIIGDDKYILYDGEPLLDCIPIAKFIPGYEMDGFFGKGMIEITEDIILSILLNTSNRFDYLGGTLHPPTWISERILDHIGGDKSVLDPEPYAVHSFPSNADIGKELYRERFPDISQQAFIEDSQLQEWLQNISGQPNFQKGISGGNSLDSGGTATGIMSIIGEGTARSLMRASTLEESGLRDCLYLTLKIGAKYRNDTESIRSSGGGKEWAWLDIPYDAISDEYMIKVGGSRKMSVTDEVFGKQMQLMQILMGNPEVKGQRELIRQLLSNSNSYDDIESILGPEQSQQELLQQQMMQENPDMISGGATQANAANSTNAVANQGGGLAQQVASGNLGV